jgi:hypothetical protein
MKANKRAGLWQSSGMNVESLTLRNIEIPIVFMVFSQGGGGEA